jgi:hypothetical protein
MRMLDKNVHLTSAQPSSAGKLLSIWVRYNSIIIWLLLVAYTGVVAFLVTVIFPVQFLDTTQSGFFEARGILALGVMGMIGVWISMYTGFPNAWDAKVTNRQRLLIPVVAGALFGALFLATDLITGLARLQQERFNIPATDLPFPASLFIYSAGAIFLEVVFRLLPIPLLLGLFSIFVRHERAREIFFWILAILTSLIEPASQSVGTQVLPPLAMGFVLLQQFGFNLLQAGFFRKYGYLASIIARIAFYVPYHYLGYFLK